ncbi:hypothetical protein [Anaeroglobus geminatus]|uniref:Uncharacterized protein n=1 Tax=Anaeroglobus geminatus F0357 TaxID=861450 RepID=G9YGR6_9FIRM|nr:hypothetical protein HMPREF0080_00836 [Anaeroglobus geminatus F0357]
MGVDDALLAASYIKAAVTYLSITIHGLSLRRIRLNSLPAWKKNTAGKDWLLRRGR